MTKPSPPAVLVITVGNSDIKFGVQVSEKADCALKGKCFPVGVFGNGREMNQWLLDNTDLWKSASATDWVDYENIRYALLAKNNNAQATPLLPKQPGSHTEILSEDLELAFKLKDDESGKPNAQVSLQTNRDCDVKMRVEELKVLGLSTVSEPSEANRLQLWLVKAMPVVIELKKKYQIKAVVVFDTCRDMDKLKKGKAHIAKNEHIAAGKLVCDWAAKYLELDNRAEENIEPYSSEAELTEKFSRLLDGAETKKLNGIAFYTRYLKGGMETDGESDNFPVNREAMSIIDNALFAVKESVAKRSDKPVTCIYSPGGGFPEYKNQIGAACHLYFDAVNKIVAPQHFDRKMLIEDADKYPAPDVSYRFREQAIQLLQHGDYAGAATIAQLVQQQIAIEVSGKSNRKKEEHYNWCWTQVLLDISQWLQGTLDDTREKAIQKDAAHPLCQLVRKHTPYALKVAFRIEAALQQNHIQEAIRYTSDLAEVLIYDYLSLVFSKEKEGDKPDYRYFASPNLLDAKQIQQLKKAVSEVLNIKESKIVEEQTGKLEVRKTIQVKESGKDKEKVIKKELVKLQGEIWEPITMGGVANSQKWQEIACSLVQEDCSSNGLKKLKDALRTKPKEHSLTPAQYRNKITHQVLSAEQIKEAIASYQAAKLWGDSVNQLEQTSVCTHQKYQGCFLSQELVKNVFKPMFKCMTGDGVDLLDLYQTLIEQTVQLIYQADIDWCEETTVESI